MSCAYADFYPDVVSVDQVQTDFVYLQTIIEEYKHQNQKYPSTENWTSELIKEYFLKQPYKDPWGHEYHYTMMNGEYKIWSFGRDGLAGGVGEDFDFSSTTPEFNSKHRGLVVEKYNTVLNVIYILLIAITALCILLFYKSMTKKNRSSYQ